MAPHAIRPAERRDLPALDAALASLSREIGDPHLAGVDALRRGLFGTPPSAWGRVADGAGGLAGLALFSPAFSTVRGGPGVYVSDLWVADDHRGSGLGAALLRDVADTAGAEWGAGFMRLAVHDGNGRAHGFYRGMGFAPVSGETVMVLEGQAFQQVRETT